MYQKVLQINTGGDESRLRSPVDLSTGNTRIPSDRDIRALRRHLLREKLASDDTTMTGQTVTGTTIDSVMEANSCLNYAQVPRESKYVANMEYDLLRMAKKRTADGDYKSLAKPGLQPDKHHSPEEKVNTDVLTDSKESSADHGEDFVLPDPQFSIYIQTSLLSRRRKKKHSIFHPLAIAAFGKISMMNLLLLYRWSSRSKSFIQRTFLSLLRS